MRRALCLAGCLLLASSCVGGQRAPAPTASPSGPPAIQPEVIARHADQFDEELAPRPAGSQQEFAAATYITAHMQQAGYTIRLDAVPLADTVRSTNVIALPGSDPEYAVVVGYDTDLRAGFGRGLGVFLELARALEVARPDHDVAFVALGAENTTRDGRSLRLGSRRFVQYALDEGLDPTIVALLKVGEGKINVFGSETDPGICTLANGGAETQGPVCFHVSGTPSLSPELYDRAGLTAVGVAGDARILARVLLKFFTSADL